MQLAKYINEVWALVNSPDFALSFSSISQLLDTNLDFYKYLAKRYFYNQEEKELFDKETDAIVLGRAIDEYLFKRTHPLGSQDWNFYLEPEICNGATREGKAKRAIWQAEAEHRQLIKFTDGLAILNMYDSLNAHQFAKHLVYDAAKEIQGKISFIRDGVKIRGEFDIFGYCPDNGYYIADLKKMPQCNNKYLSFEIFARLLHVQASIYIDAMAAKGINISRYFLIVVCPDGSLNIKCLQPKHIEMGRELVDFALNRFLYEIRLSPLKEISLLQSYPPPKQGFSYL